jgi:hypothetical protein
MHEILEELNKTSGVNGSMIVGKDGIVIAADEHKIDDVEAMERDVERVACRNHLIPDVDVELRLERGDGLLRLLRAGLESEIEDVRHEAGGINLDPQDFRQPLGQTARVRVVLDDALDVMFERVDARRGEVFEYVKQKYGADHFAQIITFGTMAARGSIRASQCFPLREGILAQLEKGHATPAVYADLSRCDYMDSTFIGLLVAIALLVWL